MAFVHGKGAVFKIDNSAGTLSTLTAYLTEYDFKQTVDTAETTTMGSEVKTYVSAQSDGTLSISGIWDSTASTGPDAILNGIVGMEASQTYELGPEGSTTGKVKYTGECFLTGYSISTPVGDVVKFTADFQLTGAVSKTTYP